MNIDTLKNLLFFVILVLLQALVLNHIHLFGYATPLLYVYFVLRARRDIPKWALLLWCFALGLAVDAFNNTPGLATTSLTLVGLLQPYVLSLFLNRESADNLLPSIATLGWGKYLFYATIIIFIQCFVIFSLEAFSFFNWLHWLLCIAGSFLLTLIIVLTIENFRSDPA